MIWTHIGQGFIVDICYGCDFCVVTQDKEPHIVDLNIILYTGMVAEQCEYRTYDDWPYDKDSSEYILFLI